MHTLPRLAALLLATVLLFVALVLPISAQEPDWEMHDYANLLTSEQFYNLCLRIRELTAQYQTDFVILTVESLDGKSPQAYANDYYDEKNCGFGPNRDGIMLLLAMESRDYYFVANGSATEKLAQAGGIAALEDKVVPHLSSGNYYLAFGMFLDTAAGIVAKPLSAPGASNPAYNDDFVDVTYKEIPITAADRWQRVGIFAVIGLAIGLVVTLLMKRSMKTARAKHLASDYVRPGSFRLTRKMDLYLYRTRTRIRVQSNNSSSGGSRSGGSRGGGGGKF
jgi:uncharacterized protein